MQKIRKRDYRCPQHCTIALYELQALGLHCHLILSCSEQTASPNLQSFSMKEVNLHNVREETISLFRTEHPLKIYCSMYQWAIRTNTVEWCVSCFKPKGIPLMIAFEKLHKTLSSIYKLLITLLFTKVYCKRSLKNETVHYTTIVTNIRISEIE